MKRADDWTEGADGSAMDAWLHDMAAAAVTVVAVLICAIVIVWGLAS